jgi:hypothetical protein
MGAIMGTGRYPTINKKGLPPNEIREEHRFLSFSLGVARHLMRVRGIGRFLLATKKGDKW